MASRKVVVTGLTELRRALSRMEGDLPKDLRKANLDAAEIVRKQAVKEVPVVSGKLKASIGKRATQTSASVKAGTGVRVPYAGPIHFGWPARGIKKNEFLYRAVDKSYDKVIKVYQDSINKLVKRHKVR